jgi:hypothetical protein
MRGHLSRKVKSLQSIMARTISKSTFVPADAVARPVPPKPNWAKFRDSFTQEQQDALWQYFLDHARLQKNGYFLIFFYIKNIDDFFRRLHFRYNKEYIRYDRAEREKEQATGDFFHMKNHSDNVSEKTQQIEQGKNIYKKFLLFVNKKIRKYLFY